MKYEITFYYYYYQKYEYNKISYEIIERTQACMMHPCYTILETCNNILP